MTTRVHYDREDPTTQIAPADLVVVDLTAGTERRFAEVTHHWVCHCDGRLAEKFHEQWDGDLYYVRDDKSQKESAWISINVRTGEVKPAAPGQPKSYPADAPVVGPGGYIIKGAGDWSEHTLVRPDGTKLKLGPILPAGWLPDGRALIVRWPGHADRLRPMYGL